MSSAVEVRSTSERGAPVARPARSLSRRMRRGRRYGQALLPVPAGPEEQPVTAMTTNTAAVRADGRVTPPTGPTPRADGWLPGAALGHRATL